MEAATLKPPVNPTLQEKALAWIGPFFLISNAIYYWIITLMLLPFERPIPKDLQTLRHRAFSKLWLAKGRAMSEEMPGKTVALIGIARGRVLDIGPGSGEQLHRFNAKDGQVTELWGVEPATDMHPLLKETAKKLGFGERFHALACGAEPESLVPALAKAGLMGQMSGGSAGIFDDICLIRVICGVPSPGETINGLYKALKPGGRFIVSEHVVNPWPQPQGSVIGRVAQFYWQHVGGWKYLMGGCQLNRDTKSMLLNAAKEDGGWAKVDLEWVNAWACVPFVVGTMTKKG